MAIIYDSQGNEIRSLDNVGGDVLTDTRPATATLAAVNAEVKFDCANTGSAVVDVRGTFAATFNVEATIDGVNYFAIPVMIQATEVWLLNITTAGAYLAHLPAGMKSVRVRCTAFTSGAAVVALRGSQGDSIMYAKPIPSVLHGTNTGASGAAVTLTLAAPGAGLFQYITRILVQRYAAAALTAGGAPVLVTTTNLPGSRVFTIPTEAAGQGTVYSEIVEPCLPLKASAANTAVTFVAPITTGVIWRISADYYNAA